jgi:pimeloyl-ACP methyl ester carboxylesterase/GNAT superfamily N-acetyltransferase
VRQREAEEPAIEFRSLGRTELSRVVEIDRRESINVLYDQHGTQLVPRHGSRSAPAWDRDGHGQHSVEAKRHELQHYVDNGGVALDALASGRLVGIGVVVPHFRPGIAQLAFLHVSAPWRATGIGSRLSELLEQIACTAGDSDMVVSATPSENTVRFYLGRGFQPVAVRRAAHDWRLVFGAVSGFKTLTSCSNQRSSDARSGRRRTKRAACLSQRLCRWFSWIRTDRWQVLCHSQSIRCTLAITRDAQPSTVLDRSSVSAPGALAWPEHTVVSSRRPTRFQRGPGVMRTFPVPGVGALLCYHDLPGDEPTIVFLHGLGAASSEEFMQTVRHPLLTGFRMVLVDFLGFGFSERPLEYGYTMEDHADSVAELLHYLDVGSVHVVGHSMGGSVAIALAMRDPDLVRNLIVAEGNLDPGLGTASARIASWSEEDYIREGHLAFINEFARSVADVPGYGGVVRTAALASPHGMHRSARSLLAERTPTFRQGLESLSIPRTFLLGERSDYPEARLLGNGVNLEIVPDAGHIMNVDNPDGFARAIADAVAQAQRGAEVRA